MATTETPSVPPSTATGGAASQKAWRDKRRRTLIRHVVLIAAAIVVLYPIVWMASASVRPTEHIFGNSGLIAPMTEWSNYPTGWMGVPRATFAQFFINSFIISGAAVLGNIVSCSMAAYAFARLTFPGRKTMFALSLLVIMLPYHVLIIPQYIVFDSLGWVNTFLPLIVPKILATDAFFIFLMVQFIRGIPRDLDEAARVDGCGPFSTYWHVIMPLAKPALVTTAIFTFIWTWNDFFQQLIYLQSVDNYTVSLGLRLFLDSQTGASAWGPMLAMGMLSILPALVLFLFFQRLLVEGIATTGLKG